jgi:hypothetical protein
MGEHHVRRHGTVDKSDEAGEHDEVDVVADDEGNVVEGGAPEPPLFRQPGFHIVTDEEEE